MKNLIFASTCNINTLGPITFYLGINELGSTPRFDSSVILQTFPFSGFLSVSIMHIC